MKKFTVVFGLLLAFCSFAEEGDFRVFAPGDKIKVYIGPEGKHEDGSENEHDFATHSVTRAWVETQAKKQPNVRFYWRQSPVEMERIYGSQEERTRETRSVPTPASPTPNRSQEWESSFPNANRQSGEGSRGSSASRRDSRTYTEGELRPQWVSGSYATGQYQSGYFKYVPVTHAWLSQQAAENPGTDYYIRQGSSSSSGPRYQPESKAVTEWRAKEATKQSERANVERLWGKPLDSLPRQ